MATKTFLSVSGDLSLCVDLFVAGGVLFVCLPVFVFFFVCVR